jgi:hypothetical protein
MGLEEMDEYPCKECIVKGVCSKLCTEVLSSDHLFEFILKNRHCPDCGEESVIDCGGDEFGHMSNLVDSCASCIECGSLYFTTTTEVGNILLRNRKYRKNVLKHVNDHEVMTFWYYLKSRELITYKEYYA